jgi:Tol biopolymer transport system component
VRYAVRTTAIAATALLVGAAVSTPSADATFRGRPGRIVLAQVTQSSTGPDTSDVYTVRADGTKGTRLTTSGTASAPAWSASGKRIAYLDSGAVMVMNSFGRNQHAVVTTGYTSSVGWSGDGRKLVLVSDRGQHDQVYVYDLRTDRTTQVTTPGKANAIAQDAVWSPRGGTIAFVRSTGGQSDLYSVRPDGTALTQLTNTPDVSEMGPDWSPDASRLVYYRYGGAGASGGCFGDGIFWTRPSTGTAYKVIDTACTDLSPRWSPDGRRILWQVLKGDAGSRARGAGLFTVRPTGKDVRKVLRGANLWFQPDWQSLH